MRWWVPERRPFFSMKMEKDEMRPARRYTTRWSRLTKFLCMQMMTWYIAQNDARNTVDLRLDSRPARA
jgi:hypothetical protein